ncbi:MAG: hypothetical protein AAFS12_11515, partial [Cyanobacteria bacterium J06632_19]
MGAWEQLSLGRLARLSRPHIKIFVFTFFLIAAWFLHIDQDKIKHLSYYYAKKEAQNTLKSI